MTNMSSRGIWAWNLVKLCLGIACLFFLLIFIFNGIGENGLRSNIRWSARMSFVLFCFAFSASGIHDYFKRSPTWWILMNRKYLGISFAIIHLIHLSFILALQLNFHPVFDLAATSSLVGGGIAYFFVVTMLLTSFETFSSHLSKFQWKFLHTFGGYWIWAIFMTSYYKRALTEPLHWIFVAVLLSVLILKGYRYFPSLHSG